MDCAQMPDLSLKKAEIQLVPTFLFLFIYAFTMDLSFEASCFSPLKRGYWFTIALFEFFLIYVTFRLICNLFRKKKTVRIGRFSLSALPYIA